MNTKNVQLSAHEGLGSTNSQLEELWLEIGGSCHLKCSYCFASADGVDNNPENLNIDQVIGVLDQFEAMGGKRIGVVGAGEPFHRKNKPDMYRILDHVRNSIKTTIFTTGDLLDAEIERLEQYPDLVLMVKYNAIDRETQDGLVALPGYTQRRDKVMQKLIDRGFNDGRLGVVTSIMRNNKTQIADILRFARRNNIIFDADTLISRGKGGSCGLAANHQELKEVASECQRIDREEFGNHWDIHCTYVASPPCTRFSYHMYMDKLGKVHPCVASQEVELGDVKTQPLSEIWDSKLTGIIRSHHYVGKCTTCSNYQSHKCYSCLGRAATDVTTESIERTGQIQTVGCFNYHKA